MARHPGRPPLDDDYPTVKVSVSMPENQYDEICRRALRNETSVPDVIRRAIKAITDKPTRE